MRFRQLWDDSLFSQLKIVWTAYQILGSNSYSIDYVPFPETFGKFAHFLSITLFNIGLPMACVDHSYNSHSHLLFVTLAPWGIVAICYFVYQARKCASPDLPDLHERYAIMSHINVKPALSYPGRPFLQILATIYLLDHSAGLPDASVYFQHYLFHVQLREL